MIKCKPVQINKYFLLNVAGVFILSLFFRVLGGEAYPAKKKKDIPFEKFSYEHNDSWFVGISRRVITPQTDVWLAGYGTKRQVKEKLHDIWVKVLALESPSGKRAVMATTDHQGMSRIIYENIFSRIQNEFGLDRSEFMLTFSHNHSGPRLRGDLVNYYPSDDVQIRLVAEYSDWMEDQVIAAVREAMEDLQPALLFKGEGECTFAVNRRENVEAEVPEILASGKSLKGVIDHYVPVLAVKDLQGKLRAILFGYACHPTTLSENQLLGDYPGYAQINLEESYPGISAMFFNASGADMNPLPRRSVELCEKYGKMLSDAVREVIAQPMQSIHPDLKTAFEFVKLDYESVITKADLLPLSTGERPIQARWASRMLDMMDKNVQFPESYDYYPVMAWQLGRELLLIGMGGETVVDYSLKFKKNYGDGSTWTLGYSNTMVAYIPSRRVWEEGGYEGGPYLDEYGHPALRWAGNIEDRITAGVKEIVQNVRN